MKPGLQLLNKIEANYRGAMDAHKLLGIVLRFKTTNGLTKQVGLLRAMHRDVVTLCFNPIDFVCFKEINTSGCFDDQTFEIVLSRFHLLQQGEDALIHTAVSITQKLCFGSLPRNIEPFLVEWLQ